MADLILSCNVCIPPTREELSMKRLVLKLKSLVLGNLRIFLPLIVICGHIQHLTSVRWRFQSVRCLSYGGVRLIEFGYNKMTEKRPGSAPGVRLIEVSVKRELSVANYRELTVHSQLRAWKNATAGEAGKENM